MMDAGQIMGAILEAVDPAAAIGTIDDLLDRFSGRVEKARRRWDLTTVRGFAQAVLAIALGLRGGERKQVARWRPSFARAIRKDWPGLTPAQRNAALREVDGLVQALGEQVASGQNVILDRFAEPIYSDARVSTIRRYGLKIGPSFSRIDFEAMESTVNLNVNFIRDREGAIAEAYSVEARDIVSDGIFRGLGRKDISKNLATRFGDMRKPSYWDFISSHYVATGRTDSSLAAYSDAGVTVYKFSAVLDERTCFVAGTPILMADDATKPIERVAVGDLVRSISGRARRVIRVIRARRNRLRRLTLRDGRCIIGTVIHPVLAAPGWIRLGDLRRGDRVASPRTAFPRFLGHDDLRLLQQGVQGTQNLLRTRQREALLDGVPSSCSARWDPSIGAQTKVLAMRESILYQTCGVGEEPSFMFEEMPANSVENLLVRVLRQSCHKKAGSRPRDLLLLRALLSPIPPGNGARTTGPRVDPELRPAFREPIASRTLDYRLLGGGARSCRDRRRVLARKARGEGARSETRCGACDDWDQNYPGSSCRFYERPNDFDPRTFQVFPMLASQIEETAIVESVEVLNGTQEVFDLTVEGEPGYIANGVIVHNSDVCRSFDGRTFSVGDTRAMLSGARSAAEEDPNSIKETNPFVHVKADEEGAFLQARQPDGRTVQVARMERSGVGTVGDRGEFTRALSSGELLGKGIGPPPLHAFCRSSIVPLLT